MCINLKNGKHNLKLILCHLDNCKCFYRSPSFKQSSDIQVTGIFRAGRVGRGGGALIPAQIEKNTVNTRI